MKQKKFKIEGTTLFVYRPQMRSNYMMISDPTTAATSTSASTVTLPPK